MSSIRSRTTLVLCRPMTLVLTQAQLDVVASLCEMAVDGSGITFGDWNECNPEGTELAHEIREQIRVLEKS